MRYRFDTIANCPDIIIRKDQIVEIQYHYNWGMLTRQRLAQLMPPMQIHLCDVLKVRQARLRAMYKEIQNDIGGTLPSLYAIDVVVD